MDRTRAPANTSKGLNVALQGGGSHGAFTWGALDALLAEPRVHIEGLSGTSAGAVYSNPYDDRFSNSGAVTLPLGNYGGTLTIDLREIPAVPEPSAVALLSVAGATLGGLGWLRQRRGAA